MDPLRRFIAFIPLKAIDWQKWVIHLLCSCLMVIGTSLNNHSDPRIALKGWLGGFLIYTAGFIQKGTETGKEKVE